MSPIVEEAAKINRMAQIKTEKEYEAAMTRIDELLPLTWGDNVPEDSPENIELISLSNSVAEYEDAVFG